MRCAYRRKLLGPETRAIGISRDDPKITAEENIRYDACLTVKHDFKPEGEVGFRTITGGNHAVFFHRGSFKKIGELYNPIFGNWLPASGKKLRNIPLILAKGDTEVNPGRRELLKQDSPHHVQSGKKCVECVEQSLRYKDHSVQVFSVKGVKPDSLPEAELYIFSSPSQIGNPPGKIRKFLKKLKLSPEGAKYAIITTKDDSPQKLNLFIEELVGKPQAGSEQSFIIRLSVP